MTSLFNFLSLPTEAGAGLQLLFDVAIKSLLILLLAKATSGLLNKSAAATRHLIWSVTVSALLALPLLTLSLPGVRLPILPTLVANATADAKYSDVIDPDIEISDAIASVPIPSSDQTAEARPTAPVGKDTASLTKPADDIWVEAQSLPPVQMLPSDNVIVRSATEPATQRKSFNWALLGIAIWLIGVLVVTARFFIGFTKVWLIARRSKSITDIAWVTLTNGLSNRLGLRKSVRVLKSEQVALPMTWGAIRSVVLLPEASDEWSLRCRSIVLLHELAHVKRRDCLTQTLAQLACAIYWFNPLVWFAARRLRVERELACDDEVIQAGTRASDYASYLVEIASSFGANVCVSPFAVGMACSELEIRVRAILNPDVKRQANSRLKVALSSVITALLIIPLATLQPWVKASTLNEKPRLTPDRFAAQEKEQGEANLSSANGSTTSHETLRSLDAIKASLQTHETVNQHSETKVENLENAAVIPQALVQPATFVEGQITGGLQGSGVGDGKGLGSGLGSGQGLGSGGGSGVGQGLGSGAGQGSGQGSGQGGKQTKELSHDETIRLRMSNVTPEYVEAVRRMGFENVTVEQIAQLRMYGVDEDYVKQIRSWGFEKPTIRELISLKIAGVTNNYVAAMKDAGFNSPSIRQLAEMKLQRVTPEFIESMRKLGFDKLTVNQLIGLRVHNINEEFIRQSENWLGSKLTLNQLMQIRVHNITPAFAEEVKAFGFGSVSLDRLIQIRVHGVTADYINEMRSLGFDNLTLEQLLKMRIHGITSEYVKKMRAAGFKNVSINQLIDMRLHGIDEILLKNSK